MVDKEFLNDIEEQKAIEEIVEKGFAGRKSSGRWKKRLMVAAAAVVIGLPVFGFAFPTVAANIPLIGGIFERSDLHGQDRLVGLGEYATVIDQTQYADGVSVTMSEAYFDGNQIFLTYLVESETSLSEFGGHVDFEFHDVRFAVDGNLLSRGGSSAWESHTIDDYSYLVVLKLMPSADMTNVEEVEVYVDFYDLMGTGSRKTWRYDREDWHTIATGSWNFSFPLTSLGHGSMAVSETTSIEDIEVTIRDLTSSSAGVSFNFSYTTPYGISTGEPDIIDDIHEATTTYIEWMVVDDFGNIVHETFGGTGGDEDDPYLVTGQLTLEPPHADATQLIITPVVYIWQHTITHDIEERERVRAEGAASGSWQQIYINEERELTNRIELEPIIVDLP